MPSVVHAPLLNTPGFMLKEKSGEPLVSAFTAVNGRASPPSPRSLHAMNGMTSDTIHVRSFPRNSPDRNQDPKAPLLGRDDWNPGPRLSENGLSNGHHSLSPSRSRSPDSSAKRKRSSSTEDGSSYPSPPSPNGSPPSRRRRGSYGPGSGHNSPNTALPTHAYSLEHQQRTLPPVDRREHDRNWHSRDSQDGTQRNYPDSRHRDPRSIEEASRDLNGGLHSDMNGADSPDDEQGNTTEITRAGVHVDPKKRKRQFANRTKTGCGTCRRRKKKCDEAKPECNNCSRGGFICEGYANKIPWPKNGVTKTHPPLQAKDRFAADSAQLYHNHGTNNREAYPDPNAPNGNDGTRARPTVVEEHERQPTANGWGWRDPPRASYPPEQRQPSDYPPPPPTSGHGRPPSNDHHAPHPSQGTPQQRQHNPRIFHHTPQTMSQVVSSSPVVTAEAALHHQSQQPHQPHSQPPMHQAPQTAAPPGPPPSHYIPAPPPPPPKSEKDKMLNGEPFQPFHPQLLEEREKCKGAVYRFNNTSNAALEIARDERDRHFRSILAAKWTQQYRSPDPPRIGHLGREVYVETPFMCDYGYNICIADRVDIGTHCKFLDSGRITVGRNTTIGPNVTIDTQRVPTDFKTIKGTKRTAVTAEVHISENVHIGANCTIMAGVRIGTGAIVYPGSVVIRDVPRDVVVRGNPAEVRVVHWED